MKVLCVILLAVFVVLCAGQAPQQQTRQQIDNDIATLNYALTLEHLEATFYTQGLDKFDQQDFVDAGYSADTRNYINLIKAHEVTHVNVLTSVINSYGALAVRPCVYNFNQSLSSVTNFIATARVLEATGTSAYDGAANTLNDATLLEVAATIATVEARHTAYLNLLNQQNPFPQDFDTALTPEEVLVAAGGFFVTCPDYFILPKFAFLFVPLSYNGTYLNQSNQLVTPQQYENDNALLNYSLTLELFGNAFYSGAANFTQADFDAANVSSAYPYFQMIIQHENAHVQFLQQALQSRGASRIAQRCTYNLGTALDSVLNALNFARQLENLEVQAYDGAINTLTEYDLIQGAATIATVEARHAQYLNNLLLNIAVNQEAFDVPFNPAQILNITAPFFGADCTAPVVPVKAYTLQEFGTNAYVQQPAPSPSPQPTPQPSGQPTTCPSQPTSSPSPSASGCGCGNNNNRDDGVTINFYFADILRGL